MPRVLAAALVRSVVLGAALAAYSSLPWLLVTGKGDASIGFGLLGFALLALASGAWAFADGTRRPVTVVASVWLLVGAAIGVGWVLALAVTQADESMSTADLLVADAGLVPFTIGLVAVPALLGSAVGQGRRG
jgi:hypothetical protein